MALRIINTVLDDEKVRLVRTSDLFNEMNDMEEQMLSSNPNNLDEEYKFMWLALKEAFAKDGK